MLGEPTQLTVFDMLEIQIEQLQPTPGDRTMTPLGIRGFAGFFLKLLEEDGWTVLIRPALSGDENTVVVEAALGDAKFRHRGVPADAAVEVFRQAREHIAETRQRGTG